VTTFGVNLSFAVKRWPEPEVWAAFVRQELEVELVQFSFDLLDPWWPDELSRPLAKRVRAAVAAEGVTLHSTFVGLAAYTYNGLLHPDAEGRRAAELWFERASDLAAEMGARVIGGPVGGVSVQQFTQSPANVRQYDDLIHTFGNLTAYAKRAGLEEWLIEPTPLKRELPWTVSGAQQLLRDLENVAALPVRYALDVGHALYRPLYGPEASLEPWLDLGRHIGLVHVQQTDGESDSHWGFARPGIVDVGALAAQLERVSVHVPMILEVFYPFEQDDEAVQRDLIASVEHCRLALEHAAKT
jgi:sugar phosphate isomerase/epimerase